MVVSGNDTLNVKIPPNELVYQESASPRDGVSSIDITVQRTNGDTAICSYIALFGGGSGVGGPQSAASNFLTGAFSLSQNYPNPFRRTTTIKLRVKSEKSKVSLKVYDLTGRLVKTLLDGGQSVTSYESPVAVRWEGRDASGRPVPNGVYFYKLKVGQVTATRKLIVLR